MGIVIRQSIYTTIISYAGVVLGYINLLYLYPRYLAPEQIGLYRVIQDAALLFTSFAQAGLSQAIVRFYPQLGKDAKSSQGFINAIFLLSLAGFALFTLLVFLFKANILNFFGENGDVLANYIPLTLWLTLILVLITLTESYSRVLLRISMPNFLREIGVRVAQGVLVIIYFLEYITFDQFLIYSVFLYALNLVILIWYLILIGEFRMSFTIIKISRSKLKEIIKYSILSLAGAGALLTIVKLDSLMVTALTENGFLQNAIYTTAFYMATVIEIPRRALGQAGSTLISRAFEREDINEVSVLYKKTTINQFAIGCLLFIGIWANLETIFQLIPKNEIYSQGFNVVIIIGVVKLIDMIFGPNGEIIIMSRYYWFHTATLVIMILLSVSLNYYFIPRYGIEGAAVATGITYLVFNGIKSVFIYSKFQTHPFSIGCLKVVGISILVMALNKVLPITDNHFIDLFYRSAIITVVYTTLIIVSKSSAEINELFNKGLMTLKSPKK